MGGHHHGRAAAHRAIQPCPKPLPRRRHRGRRTVRRAATAGANARTRVRPAPGATGHTTTRAPVARPGPSVPTRAIHAARVVTPLRSATRSGRCWHGTRMRRSVRPCTRSRHTAPATPATRVRPSPSSHRPRTSSARACRRARARDRRRAAQRTWTCPTRWRRAGTSAGRARASSRTCR